MGAIDDLSTQLLVEVVADFRGKNLGADALDDEYVGVSLTDLKAKHCVDAGYTDVDFDLAVTQLEEMGHVKTGPMSPYENPPDSALVVLGFFSTREYAYLTTKGYKAAQKRHLGVNSMAATVHISGGNIGALNLGGFQNVHNIDIQIAELRKADQSNNIATALECITKALSSGDVQLSEPIRTTLLEHVEELSEQATRSPEKRRRGTVEATFTALGTACNMAGGLAAVWQTWGPVISRFFGL